MKIITLPYLLLTLGLFCSGCTSDKGKQPPKPYDQYITVLGIAQDAGYPQIHCDKDCCKAFYNNKEPRKHVSCLGLVDLEEDKKWLFDATPDITQQVRRLKTEHLDNGNVIDGIFLTHGHIGHYTGLMHLGVEAMAMKTFLESNGPWSQLVTKKNIDLKTLKDDSLIQLNTRISVTPMRVPHRDEYTETVGYRIRGKNKSALFIPDINKWHVWDRDIIEEVKKVDYAFLDASFFKDGEISRPMGEIPHPFTTETTSLFENESEETKSKIYFIHFNHTNPTILNRHRLKDSLRDLGFNFAREGDIFEL
jgi:pyrroloquinoline quinone biosynthesis protein B